MNQATLAKLHGLLKFGRAVRFVWDGAPFWTVINVFVVFVQGLMPLAALYLFKRLIDAVIDGLRHPYSSHRVLILAFDLGIVAVVTALSRSAGATVSEIQSQQVTDRMQEVLHERSILADLEYYEDTRYYDTLHRAQQEAPVRPTRIVNNLVQLTQNTIALIGIAALLLVTIRWQFALILLAVVLPSVVVKLSFANRLHDWQRANTATERRVRYYDWLITGDHGAKELRLFSLGRLFMQRACELRARLRIERFRIVGQRAVGDALSQTFAAAAVYGAFGFLAVSAVQGAITLGALVMFFQAFIRGQAALQDILNAVSDLYENSLFLNNLYEFLDLKPRLVEPAAPTAMPRPIRQGIRFEHISFKYGHRGRAALSDVSFEINAGEVVAIVGANGSGKTTLIKLLCRLYDPTEGRITIDGISLDQFRLEQLRREFSVVFQDYAQYNLSARENIWLGDTSLPEHDEMIEIAAHKAGADRLIATLPDGYETKLGHAFDNGTQLSVGQWQKIALARSFVRDAQIVILDEPSSALDAMAEYEIFETFRDLVQGRTAILISHRLSTVRMADKILVLEDGRMVEQGSHAELVRMSGAYARLFETQARNYASST